MKINVFYKYMNKQDGTKFKKWLVKTTDDKIFGVKFVANALTNVPKTRFDNKSALEIIQVKRPAVYKKLLHKGVVKNKKR